MLTIRPEQMGTFGQAADDKFTTDIIRHLHRVHPETVTRIAPTELCSQVNQRKVKARSYGMTGQAAITGFIALTFKIGSRFDFQPAIHAVLTDPAVEPNHRIQQLRFRVTQLDWSEATRM